MYPATVLTGTALWYDSFLQFMHSAALQHNLRSFCFCQAASVSILARNIYNTTLRLSLSHSAGPGGEAAPPNQLPIRLERPTS